MSLAQRDPCTCEACTVAGVSHRPQLKSRKQGEWLHGKELRRVYEAQDAFWAVVNRMFGRKA